MVRTNTYAMGDRDCFYGEKVWEETEVTCDECGDELLNEDDVLYEYEGKWICLECLKEKFEYKTAEQLQKEYEESSYLDE
jgi:formylmethanofuran dehydrogenase subunit E